MATSLQHLREITNLDSVSVTDVLQLFASFTDSSGYISREAFYQAFKEISEGSETSEKDLKPVVDQLYSIFDTNQDGRCDFVEVSTGLTVLTAGSRDEKARSAFALFDYDGSGSISRDEMERYLTCVFRVVYEIESQTKDAMGVAPEKLAKITTDQCFAEADLDEDDSLSFEEFKKWYSRPSGSSEKSTSNVVRQYSEKAAEAISLESVKKITGLSKYSVEDVMERFAEVTDDSGMVHREAFNSVFLNLNKNMTQDEEDRLRLCMDRLFNAIDYDGSNSLDFVELSTGISTLCGGSRDMKAAAAFALYDVNGDGTIDMDEMIRYLTSVFRIMYSVEPGTEEKMGCSAEELASVTTKAAFEEAGLSTNDSMSFDQFQQWYSGGETGQIVKQASDAAAGQVTLEELKRISGLGRRSAAEVMEMFAQVTDEEGYVSMEGFAQVFESLTEDEDVSSEDLDKLHVALGRLFETMDVNGDGKVDFVELSSGVSTLTGGSVDEKTSAAFALYDVNGDGFISLSEFEHYLTSVFKVMYELESGTEEAMGCGPTELAIVTAAQAFKECDINADGKLSYEEFSRWYNSSDDNSSAKLVQEAANAAIENISLAEIRRVTTLGQRNVQEVLEIFANATDEHGLVSEEDFDRIFEEFTKDSSEDDKDRLHLILGRLFELAEGVDGSVDFQELASFLSILCAGSRDERARIAFSLYDYNGDNQISYSEMKRFLTSIFKVMYEAEPSTREQMQCDPETLAEVTTQDAFEKLGLEKSDMMTYELFESWYTSTDSGSTGAMVRQASSAAQQWISLDEIKRITTLGARSVDEVLSHFKELSDEDGNITEEAFDELFERYVGKNLTQDDADKLHLILGRLFDMFDEDNNQLISYSEFATGISILCQGTRDERAKAAFQVVDEDGDGFIDMDELTKYLSSVFRIMYEVEPATETQMGTDYNTLAKVTAGEAFKEADKDENGLLSYDEFKLWYSSEGENDLGTLVRDVTDSAAEHLSLAEMRDLTNLSSYSVEEMCELLAAVTNEEGWVSKENFDICFQEIAKDNMENDPVRFKLVLGKLFKLFDRNDDKRIDFSEITTALTVLCRGGRDEKAATAFALWDSDGDGTITLDEMKSYLACVFALMYEANPETKRHMQVSAEELAEATAAQAFNDADLNHDGQLTFEEFQKWYNSSSEDDGEKGKRAEALVGASERAASWVSQDEIKRITGFGVLTTSEILEVFAEAADEEGYISRDLFKLCCVEIAGTDLTQEDSTKLQIIIRHLFETFSGEEGKVDFVDLGAACACLSSGDIHDKSRTVFALYDTDGSQTISLEEFERLLTSVYKVMMAVEPSSNEIGMSAEELALTTAASVFKEADLDNNGMLEWDEFQKWYEGSEENDEVAEEEDEEEEEDTEEQDAGDVMDNLDFVREITTLGNRSVMSVLEMFAKVTDESGYVHEEDFDAIFEKIADAQSMSDAKRDLLGEITDRLFTLFDQNHDGVCDFTELAVGLSVLCSSPMDEKAEILFKIFDHDDSGSIEREEMERYLKSVFLVMYEMDPDAETRIGCGALELAITTTDTCFKNADLNGDGKLSLEEFKRWYGSEQGNLIQQASDSAVQSITMEDVRRITTLGERDVAEVLETFALKTDDEGYVSSEAFDSIFMKFTEDSSETDRTKLELVLDRLYSAFDTNSDGKLDFQELAAGICTLCQGDIAKRSEACFRIFDYSGDGIIQKDELTRFLKSIFSVMYAIDESAEAQTGMDASTLAMITAEGIFKEYDIDHSGGLSLEEFTKWYSTPEGQAVQEVADQVEKSWVSLPEIKRLTGFGARSYKDVLEKFASLCDDNGYVSRSSFEAVCHSLAPLSELSAVDRERLHIVHNRLFNTIDIDKNGLLDYVELSSALSVLCGGSMKERANMSFSLYDLNGDGVITLDEMTRYLTSVFRVLYEADESLRIEGVSADELAVLTAKNCFEHADLNHDDVLSKEEFEEWYNSSDGQDLHQVEQMAQDRIDLAEIRRLTTLDQSDLLSVLDKFASKTDDEGFIQQDDFEDIFDELTKDSSQEDRDRLHLCLGRLYDALAGDDDKLDFQEIAVFCCIMCCEDKNRTRIAFDIFDVDSSGSIEISELKTHLEIVFKIMLALVPQLNRGGVDASTLALISAERAMKEADVVERDGKISFEEFKKWYEKEEESKQVHEDRSMSALDRVKEITTLGSRDIKDTLTLFASKADDRGIISEEDFDATFEEMIKDPHPDLQDTLDVLYTAIDQNGDGELCIRELMIGLIVLCGGDLHTKSIAAFKLFDIDNSNYISKDEMETYLHSVYKILYAVDPSLKSELGMDAAALAQQSTLSAMSEGDLDHDGKISWSEFQKWYMGDTSTSVPSSSDEQQEEEEEEEEEEKAMSLNEVREVTGLGKTDIMEVLERVADVTDMEGLVPRKDFHRVFEDISGSNVQESPRLHKALALLWTALDVNHDGVVDFCEFASGISILAGGSPESKLRAQFDLYDIDGNGSISLSEMTRFLESVFKVMYACEPQTQEEMQMSPEELADQTARKAFEEADRNQDGSISFDEYVAWATREEGTGAVAREATKMAKSFITIQRIRDLTNLGDHSVYEMLELFAAATSDDGTISRAAFMECFKALAGEDLDEDDSDALRLVVDRVYDIFAASGVDDDVVDFVECCSGLSVLCEGHKSEKVQAVFALYDVDETGSLEYDEMCRFLSSVFKIALELMPEKQVPGLSAEELAEVTTADAFKKFGLKKSGRMSFEDFETWSENAM